MEIELERRADLLFIRIRGDMRLWGRSEPDRVVKVLRQGFEGQSETTLTLEDLIGRQLLAQTLETAGQPRELVLNLRGMTSIDSLGMGALVRIPIECVKRTINLKVIMPLGLPGEALRTVGFFHAWPQFPGEDEAIGAAAG